MSVLKFMSVNIIYKNVSFKKNFGNEVLFVDEKFSILSLKKYISVSEFAYISDLLKTNNNKKNIISYDIGSKRKIILVSTKKKLKPSDFETLGASFYNYFKNTKQSNFTINTDTITNIYKDLIGYFLHGIKLKSYIFEKYKSKKEKKKYNYKCYW